MRTVEKTVYKFDELSDEAKEVARQWWRECEMSEDWWRDVYEDADTIAKIIGIQIDRKPVTLMGGSNRYDPCIWFNGFSSQGDGACFEGKYYYAKGSTKNIRSHCNDAELFRITDELAEIQKKHRYKVYAEVVHVGHYPHSRCTDIDVEVECGELDDSDREYVRELLRDFMDWIYKQLEADHDYRTDDEYVDENILANDYEFEESGDIY